MNSVENTFMMFLRAKQIMTLRLRGDDIPIPVYIPKKLIQERFKGASLTSLVDHGEIRITKQHTRFGHELHFYEALKQGPFDLRLLIPSVPKYQRVINQMRNNLILVSLPEDAASTPYFDLFLKHKKQLIDLFFKVDEFCGRIHTPVTNFHRTHRPYLLLDGQDTASLDVTTMQPLLLGKILKDNIGGNEYSGWIDSGEDIYIMLQTKARLETRDQGKKKFFEILFSPADQHLAHMFGNADWINWINKYKTSIDSRNPHTYEKHYSNMAWLLQSTEVAIMRAIWRKLVDAKILFLSVHDEIITQAKDIDKTEKIMSDVLCNVFTYFNLNRKTSKIGRPITLHLKPDISISETDKLSGFNETHMGVDFDDMILVYVGMANGNQYDILMDHSGNPITQKTEKVELLERQNNKQFVPGLLYGDKCLINIILPENEANNFENNKYLQK